MTYDLKSELDKIRFKQRCNHLYKLGKVVELTEKREPKSPNQNRYIHLIMTWFGLETGYTADEVKQDIVKREVCRDIFGYDKGGRVVFRSFADLTKEETTIVIDRFRNWSSKTVGIYLPEPGEADLIREMEREMYRRGNVEFLN